MKRLLLIGLVGLLPQASQALFGSVSPVDKAIKETESVLSQANDFCTAERKKLDKQGVTPAVLKQDLQKIESFKLRLTSSIENIAPLLARTSSTYYDELQDSYEKNFKGLNFDVGDVYPYLQAKLMPQGKPGSIQKLSTAEIKQKLSAYADKLNDPERRTLEGKKCRQISYLFRNDIVREQFDAFLQGPVAVKRLAVPNQQQKVKLEKLMGDEIPKAKMQIEDFDHEIKYLLK